MMLHHIIHKYWIQIRRSDIRIRVRVKSIRQVGSVSHLPPSPFDVHPSCSARRDFKSRYVCVFFCKPHADDDQPSHLASGFNLNESLAHCANANCRLEIKTLDAVDWLSVLCVFWRFFSAKLFLWDMCRTKMYRLFVRCECPSIWPKQLRIFVVVFFSGMLRLFLTIWHMTSRDGWSDDHDDDWINFSVNGTLLLL